VSSGPRAARYAKLHRNGFRICNDNPEITARKIRALMAIGYTRQQISDASGVGDKKYISVLARGSTRIYPQTAAAINHLYDRWHMTPQVTTAAKRVVTSARRQGWAPPLAWDDINDPDCAPDGIRQTCGTKDCDEQVFWTGVCRGHYYQDRKARAA
jgi:hypothetical protein